jgi:hypothetical protein
MDAAPRKHARPLFHRYGNRSGHSGVAGYALVGEGIAVKFSNGAIYLYDRGCPGRMHVSRMTQLAREGSGLATSSSRRVGQRYAARLDEGAPGRAGSRAHGAAGTRTDARQSSTRQNTAFR